jgi:histidinol dehydrogenase
MEIKPYVGEILAEIKSEGEKAVQKHSEKFDGYRGPLQVPGESFPDRGEIPAEEAEAINRAIDRVRSHHENQVPDDEIYLRSGSLYGTIHRPLDRIGIYVPGGNPLPSTLIMTAVPARLAGVEEIIVTSPPSGGEVNSYVLYVAELLDLDRVYRLGGVQAIGAMAYGAGLPAVDKIFGPGNSYVNEAKRQVYGEVGIDGLAGPSEVCVIADGTARKDSVLADLRAQLEHGDSSRAWLITTSEELASHCTDSEAGIEVKDDLGACIDRANEIAPEHLEIMTEAPEVLLDDVRNAGAVYMGEFTPAAAADYFLGVNHVLPTGRAARFDSVLTVRDFLKPISVARTTKEEFFNNSEIGVQMAKIEGMTQHLNSLEVRGDEEKNS